MKCVKCGRILPEDSKFCKYCGTTQPAPATNLSATKENPERRRNLILSLVLGVVALGLVVLIILVISGDKTPKPTQDLSSAPMESHQAVETDGIPTDTVQLQAPTDTEETQPAETEAPETQPVETQSTESDPESAPEVLSSGSVNYKGMEVTCEQTGEKAVEMRFVNNGGYHFTFWFQAPGDYGFTVIGTDEKGNKESVVVQEGRGNYSIAPYASAGPVSVNFTRLTGRIVSVEILGVEYQNSDNQFDFNNSQKITVNME